MGASTRFLLGFCAAAVSIAGAALLPITPAAAQGPIPSDTATASSSAPPATSASGAQPNAASQEADSKERAKLHFVRGLELIQNESWDAALAEFLVSREIYATRVAVKNAALCLRQLKRYAAALAMYKELLQRFGTGMDASEKRAIEEAVAQLSDRVGELTITSSVPGATVIVAGLQVGRTPISEPILLDAGTHTVRVFKEGYLPFETQIPLAGRQKKAVQAELHALAESGTLTVAEAEGRKLAVLVDGAEVGKTPWTGTLAVGPHAIVLRGDANLGTPPSSANVAASQATRLTLHAVPLEAELRVEPTPSNARVDIDGVAAGNGVWDGRLGVGQHRIEVSAEGFLAFRKDVAIGKQRMVLPVMLDRDPTDPRWKASFRGYPYVEAMLGPALGASLGGSLDGACSAGDCVERSRPLGGAAMARAGYQFTRLFGAELGVGYLTLSESATRRIGAQADFPVTSSDFEDTARLSGVLLGVSASVRPIEGRNLLARLGAGLLRGRASFSNRGDFSGEAVRASDPTQRASVAFPISVPETSDTVWAPFLAPEVRYGFRLAPRFVLDVGLTVMLLFPPEPLRQGTSSSDRARGVRSQQAPTIPGAYPDGGDVRPGMVVLPRETGFSTFVTILPTLGGRWDL